MTTRTARQLSLSLSLRDGLVQLDRRSRRRRELHLALARIAKNFRARYARAATRRRYAPDPDYPGR